MGRWDEFDADAMDPSGADEVTKQTGRAHEWAIHLAWDQWGEDGRYAIGGARLRLLSPNGFVVEVRGQTSASGHGKQGADPRQIAELRALDEPVLMVFLDGSRVQWFWLDDPDVPVVNIDMDTAHRRQGWNVGDMANTPDSAFRFPTEVPEFEASGLF